MQQSFKVRNVKCSGCASTLKKKLHDKFGEVEVNLDVEPREITLDISEDKIDALGIELKKLGYPLVSESMGFVESSSTKAKSFVSSAVGKINQ